MKLCNGPYLKMFIFMPFGSFCLGILIISFSFLKEEALCVSEAQFLPKLIPMLLFTSASLGGVR